MRPGSVGGEGRVQRRSVLRARVGPEVVHGLGPHTSHGSAGHAMEKRESTS
jgi:hypothetical protein